MKRIQSRPYLTPQSDRLVVEGWEHQVGDQFLPLGERIPDWDPAAPINIHARVRLSIHDILNDCKLPPDVKFRMAVIWESSGTKIRGRGEKINIHGFSKLKEYVLSTVIDGKLLADTLSLTVSLLYIDPGSGNHPLMPRQPGSILLQSPIIKVQLEGDGVRFPTEVIDFSSTYYPQDAGWMLVWDPDSLEQSLFGDVRLYLNARHPKVVSAVTNMDEGSLGIREAVRLDLAQTLIRGALSNDDFIQNPDRYPKGSIGAAARAMISLYFAGYNIESIQSMLRRPHDFSAFLQDKLRVFSNEL